MDIFIIDNSLETIEMDKNAVLIKDSVGIITSLKAKEWKQLAQSYHNWMQDGVRCE